MVPHFADFSPGCAPKDSMIHIREVAVYAALIVAYKTDSLVFAASGFSFRIISRSRGKLHSG